jgi:hypothetical protein
MPSVLANTMRLSAGWLAAIAVTIASGAPVDSGEFSRLPRAEFIRSRLSFPAPAQRLRAADFLRGRSHSEAIEAAQASARATPGSVQIILDSHDWVVNRAIVLSSATELLIDGCALKLADGVFDNIIRIARLTPDPRDPHGLCLSYEPVRQVKVTGVNGALIEGAERPYTAANPKTGVTEPWVGDYFGWRTVGILIVGAENYEISGLTMRKTHCWAISQEHSRQGYLHDLVFQTAVKNGDGINFRNGCAYARVENISGSTSDDTVACTALDRSVMGVKPQYIWPMQAMGYPQPGATGADIHDIVIKNVSTTGKAHGVICLATSPSVYNISIEGVVEPSPSMREACVKLYTGYGSGYTRGNLRNITVRNVTSRGAKYAVMVKADVVDVSFAEIRQFRAGAVLHSFSGDSQNLTLTP